MTDALMEKRSLFHACSAFHYRMQDMDTVLAPYVGDTDAFFQFLEQEWGWKISTEKSGSVIFADENKAECVCPVKDAFAKSGHLEDLCYCSEGFTARMFSRVMERPVRVDVIRSVLRGGSSCIYRIDII